MVDEEGNTPFLFPGKIKGYEQSFPDLDRINPAYFRNMDRKIDYLNAHGFMPFVEVARRDIGQGWKRAHGWPDSYVRYIQYVWSRLQANNCLLSPIHYDSGAQSITAPEWNLAANRVIDLYGAPPFGNPVGCNAHWTSLLDFGHTSQARWLTFHQSGNGQRHHYTYAQITDLFNTNPPVPVLNGEPQYEGMETLSHQPDPNWHWGEVRVAPAPSEENARTIRSAAYGSVLSGGLAGHIYGSGGWDGGIWRGDVEEASRVRIWEGMSWPAAAQMQHLSAFVMSEGDRYRDLVPSPQLLSPNRSGPVASYDGWSYCLRDPRARPAADLPRERDARHEARRARRGRGLQRHVVRPAHGAVGRQDGAQGRLEGPGRAAAQARRQRLGAQDRESAIGYGGHRRRLPGQGAPSSAGVRMACLSTSGGHFHLSVSVMPATNCLCMTTTTTTGGSMAIRVVAMMICHSACASPTASIRLMPIRSV